MKRVTIEVAVETVEDAKTAEDAGADRLLLCSALDLGGLTPSLGLYLEVRAVANVPVVITIRPRAGDFVYSSDEFRVMLRDVAEFLKHRPSGFAFAVVLPDGSIDAERSGAVAAKAWPATSTFHRAFDKAPDPEAAIGEVIKLGFSRVYTSGREATAFAGASAIAKLVRQAGEKIAVIPCGRIDAKAAVELIRLTNCSELHGSFAEDADGPDDRGFRGYPVRSRTSRPAVEAVRTATDQVTTAGR